MLKCDNGAWGSEICMWYWLNDNVVTQAIM